MNAISFDIYISCTPGLEQCLAHELEALGIHVQPAHIECGGLLITTDFENLIRCSLALRTANRILVRMGSFYAAGFPELKRKIKRLPLDRFLEPGQSIDIQVSCRKSKLYHAGAVKQRAEEVLSADYNIPIKIAPDSSSEQRIDIRLMHDQVTVSIDAIGSPLYQRGYKLATAKAPLRETIAAALVMSSGWDDRSPLVDPFCGSGTIPIEACMIARRILPNFEKTFSYQRWPSFNPDLKHTIIAGYRKPYNPGPAGIYGGDRDQGAVNSAEENAKRAGVQEFIHFKRMSISDWENKEEQGWIVTNPPYGVRIRGGPDLRNLYARWGQVLRKQYQGWNVTFLCNDPRLAGQTGLALKKGPLIDHGGLKVNIFSALVT